MTPAPKRRWFTFSVGRLFELMTICALVAYAVAVTPAGEPGSIARPTVAVSCLALAATYYALQSTVPVLLRHWRARR
jgi:hypothetical protein